MKPLDGGALAGFALAAVLSCALRPDVLHAGESLESLASREFVDVRALAGLMASARSIRFSPPPRETPDEKSAQPDWGVTPGRLCTADDPDFSEYRYAEKVPYCKRNVTAARKKRVAAQYGVPWEDAPKFEFDHLIPVCVGGSSQDGNIWPQPRGDAEADGKDKVENQVCARLRAGTMTQAQAVKAVMDWFKGYLARRPARS